jgi:uroporphyrinogen decarboxylase
MLQSPPTHFGIRNTPSKEPPHAPLTSRERVARVLAGELPDRVPVLMQNFQNTAYLAGMTLAEFCRSGARMAEAQLAAWERFGYDIIDLENGTATMAEACGCEVEYPEHEPPQKSRHVALLPRVP